MISNLKMPYLGEIITAVILLSCFCAPGYGVDQSSSSKHGVVPTVRSIRIIIRDIFDEPNIGRFYRTVNALKASTRREVVRRELLFSRGDSFDRFLMEESERNLRSLPFLRQVSITPLFDGPSVDVIVSVQDTWTLFPFINLSSGGGTSRRSAGLTEGNILGYGKRLEVLYADDEGREKVEAVWHDPRVLGTYKQLTLGHFNRSDGNRSVVSFGRPFRSVVERYAWAMDIDQFDLVGRLFEGGDERYVYREDHLALAGGFTVSKGDPKVRRNRYTLGWAYRRALFDQADSGDFNDIDVEFDEQLNDPKLLASDRRFSGPVLGWQRITQDFLSTNYVDRFDRVQDFNLGNEFDIGLHFAARELGSRENTLLARISDSEGWRFGEAEFLRAAASLSARINEDEIENVLLHAEIKYYNVMQPSYYRDIYLGRHTIAAALRVDMGEKFDLDRELLLGAGNGLRGYEDRTFSGDSRIIFNAEDRFHIWEDLLRLVSIGGAVFVDAGGTSRKNLAEIITDNFYADVGFGLRFGLTRSSGGSVLRVDVAFPLRDGLDDSQRFEPRILITTGQLFGAGLSTERSNTNARISSGFLP